MAKGGYRPNSGRPKAQHTVEAEAAKKVLVAKFVANQEPIFEALISKSLTGDVPAIKELFERVWGKEAQPLSGEVTSILDVPQTLYNAILGRERQRNSLENSSQE